MRERTFPHMGQYFYFKRANKEETQYYVTKIGENFIEGKQVNGIHTVQIYESCYEDVAINTYFHKGDYIKIISKDIRDFQECEYGHIVKSDSLNDFFNYYDLDEQLFKVKMDNGNEFDLYNNRDNTNIILINEDFIKGMKEKIGGKDKMENKTENKNVKEILKKWVELNKKAMTQKKDEKIKKVYERDMVVIDLKAVLNQARESFNAFEEKYPNFSPFTIIAPQVSEVITDDSKEEIEKIEVEHNKAFEELKDTANTVLAATSICETEESLRKILKTYGIIDSNGKIKII